MASSADSFDPENDPDGLTAARLTALAAERARLDAKRLRYAPDDVARAGAFVTLGQDGAVRVERGYVRNEDAVPVALDNDAPEEIAPTRHAPHLSDRLVAELTAHRTAALRCELADQPDLALAALVHGLALQAFHRPLQSCLDIRLGGLDLAAYATGLLEAPAGAATEARHAAWAAELPSETDELWDAILAMGLDRRLRLLAHCVSRAVDAVSRTHRAAPEPSPADRLATALRLDMTRYWSATVDNYLGRVTKGFIDQAVREAAGAETANRLRGLSKTEMAQAAERRLEGRGWLPDVLRTTQAPADPDCSRVAE
jgi:ParB family chromosome partitioning protein